MSHPYSNLSDTELLVEYQNGKYDAFNVFYKRHRKLIFNFLFKRMQSKVTADEAFQETFMRVHKYILKFDPAKSALAWVFGIANNVAINTSKKTTFIGSTFNEESDSLETKENNEFKKIEASFSIEEILLGLKESERELLIRRFLSAESFEEIAEQLQSRPDSIRQRFSRILKKIRNSHEDAA